MAGVLCQEETVLTAVVLDSVEIIQVEVPAGQATVLDELLQTPIAVLSYRIAKPMNLGTKMQMLIQILTKHGP